MKPRPIAFIDKIHLMKRGVIECCINALKNQAYAEHSRHRSLGEFLINIFSALCAYSFESKKPTAHFDFPFLVNIDQKYLIQ